MEQSLDRSIRLYGHGISNLGTSCHSGAFEELSMPMAAYAQNPIDIIKEEGAKSIIKKAGGIHMYRLRQYLNMPASNIWVL